MIESLQGLVKKFNEVLTSLGAEGPGDFKVYASGSRLRVFIKANKLPFQPTVEVTLDLPGEADAMTAQAFSYMLQAGKVNEQPPAP